MTSVEIKLANSGQLGDGWWKGHDLVPETERKHALAGPEGFAAVSSGLVDQVEQMPPRLRVCVLRLGVNPQLVATRAGCLWRSARARRAARTRRVPQPIVRFPPAGDRRIAPAHMKSSSSVQAPLLTLPRLPHPVKHEASVAQLGRARSLAHHTLTGGGSSTGTRRPKSPSPSTGAPQGAIACSAGARELDLH